MPSQMHKTMGELSYASLSVEDRDAWGLSSGFADCTPDFLTGGEEPQSAQEKMGAYSFFLDRMGWCAAQWERYPQFLLPGLVPVPHGLADRDMSTEGQPDPDSWRAVLRHFLPRMVDELRAGRREEAALYGGLLAHFLQDSSSFGHLLPNSMYYEYMPEDTDRHVLYHHDFDECDPPLERVKPALLGTTVEEAVFRLGAMGDRNVALAKRMFFPMMCAVRCGDKATMNSLSAPLLQSGIYMVASLWHTALALGLDRIKLSEAAELATFDLCDAIGYSVHPGNARGYGTVFVGSNVVDTRLVPLVLDMGSGPANIERGFGMTSFNSIKFVLEPGAFDWLEGGVGLSARCLQDQDAGMNVEFFVGLDETHNRIVSTELNYGPTMTRAFSCKLAPGKPAEKFRVRLGGAKTLIIAAITRPDSIYNDDSCRYPHIVVADPTLRKN